MGRITHNIVDTSGVIEELGMDKLIKTGEVGFELPLKKGWHFIQYVYIGENDLATAQRKVGKGLECCHGATESL